MKEEGLGGDLPECCFMLFRLLVTLIAQNVNQYIGSTVNDLRFSLLLIITVVTLTSVIVEMLCRQLLSCYTQLCNFLHELSPLRHSQYPAPHRCHGFYTDISSHC